MEIIGRGDVDPLVANEGFEIVGVPPPTARPWSIRTMWSASASASSRYWVVRNKVTPLPDEFTDRRPDDLAAAGVQARGGLVEDEEPGLDDQTAARSTRRAGPPDTDLISLSRNSPMSKRSIRPSTIRGSKPSSTHEVAP